MKAAQEAGQSATNPSVGGTLPRLVTPREVRKVLGYARVSTSEQEDSGLGLEAQQAAIEAECGRKGWTLLAIHTDVASGRSTNGRYELQAALAALDSGKADALVAFKLDRVSRSVVDFGSLLDRAARRGWALVLIDLGLDMSTPVGEMVAHMLAAVAQFERKRIGERTREAMAIAKKRGPAPGKKPIGRSKSISDELEQRIVRMRDRGQSFEAIAAKLTADRVPTPTGHEVWGWTTVSRVVKRHRPAPPGPA